MEEQKPRSIKTIGRIVVIFSAFIIFSNGMGALAWSVTGIGEDFKDQDTGNADPIAFVLSHYVEMCMLMLLIGTGI